MKTTAQSEKNPEKTAGRSAAAEISRSGPVIMPKINIGEARDKYENEADKTADQVMRVDTPPVSGLSTLPSGIQQQPIEEEEEEIQMQPWVQLQEEEEILQASPENSGAAHWAQKMDNPPQAAAKKETSTENSWLSQQMQRSRISGNTLNGNTRRFMESRFAANLGDVRIHTDPSAQSMNAYLGSRAFTNQSDIYFNNGQYDPESFSGRHLLAHELTHVIQQKSIRNVMLQRDNGEESARETPTSGAEQESSSGGSDPLARFVGGIIRDQMSDSNMRGHLQSLAEALQGLAIENSAESAEQPGGAAERMAGLGIPNAFRHTAGEILESSAFGQLRSQLISRIGSSDELALATLLSAGLAAYFADVDLSGDHSFDLGSGFGLEVEGDLGSTQDIQLGHIRAYATYARDHFSTQLGGGVSRSDEGEIIGEGRGEFRLGNDTSNLTGRIMIDSSGQLQVSGRLASGFTFGGSDRLIFTTDVSHVFGGESDATTIETGVTGRFSLGPDQSLNLGGSMTFTTDSGLSGASGFLEYQQDSLRLRIEANMTGIPEAEGIMPGGNMQVQGVLEWSY